MAIWNTLWVSPLKPAIQMGVVWALGKQVTPQTVKSTQTGIVKQEQQKSSDMVSKYKQLVSNWVDPQRAKSLLIKAQQPQAEQSTIKNVWEWLTSFAWWLPKVISETWILDKPVSALAQKVVNPLRSAIGKEALTPEQISSQKFSQMASGSQVGWDPESKVAKRVETWLNIAEWVTWLAAVGKALSKRAAKKWIEEVVSAKGTQRQMAEAIAEGRVKPWATGIKKFLFGSKPQVVEKQSIQNATKTIASEIKNPAYKQPTKLFSQIDDLIETKAKTVANDLKWLKIWSFTKDKAKTYKLIQNGIVNNDAVNKFMTPKEIKNLKTAIEWIKKAKTADQLRDARKALDLATPDSVKKATSISSDILQYRNALWKQARAEINDLIEASATKYWKSSVKDVFRKMSELYQAQDNILSKAGKIVKETPWVFSASNLKKAAVVWGTAYGGNKLLNSLWQ